MKNPPNLWTIICRSFGNQFTLEGFRMSIYRGGLLPPHLESLPISLEISVTTKIRNAGTFLLLAAPSVSHFYILVRAFVSLLIIVLDHALFHWFCVRLSFGLELFFIDLISTFIFWYRRLRSYILGSQIIWLYSDHALRCKRFQRSSFKSVIWGPWWSWLDFHIIWES